MSSPSRSAAVAGDNTQMRSWLLELIELDGNDAKRSDVIAVGERRRRRGQSTATIQCGW